MDIRLLLVKSITLLYQEALMNPAPDSPAKQVVSQLAERIQLPESQADDGVSRNVLAHLRATLLWMLGCKDSQAYDRAELLQRLRVNVAGDDKLYEAFLEGIREFHDEVDLRQSVNKSLRSMRSYLSREQTKALLKKASHTATFRENDIADWGLFIQKTARELTAIDMGEDPKQDGSFVSSIDLSDAKSVAAAFEDMESSLSEEGKVIVPWQGVNRMFGETQGMRRGEFHEWNALPHNYKSGLLMDLFIGACLFNDPFLFDKEKKPAIVFFSTEDDMPVIIKKMYVILMQHKHGLPVNMRDYDKEAAVEFVMSELTYRGWHVFMHRVRPSMFTYDKYIATMEDYNTRGYELAMVVCDYLSMFNKKGCNNASTGDDIQDLFRRVREYTSAKRIIHCTAHQLSTEAKALKRIDEENFIKQLPGKGYYEGCRKLDTELDFEGYINKREARDGTYLEFLWGKHRKVGSTDEKDKYVVLKFRTYPMYGLAYDIGLPDSSYTKVGGRAAKDGGGGQYFDLDD